MLAQDFQTDTVSPSRQASSRLYDEYDRMFQTITADTDSLREECFRIRYEVYCIERQFEDPSLSPERLERDAYDSRSVHSLLYDRSSGVATGTVRLVLGKSRSVPSLPFHSICKEPLARDPMLLPFETTAEVSRLAISKRRSETASCINGTNTATDLTRVQPKSYVALGLLRMVVEMAVASGVEYLCAVMEPALLRMLARCGIHFEALGPLVEHHGIRQPCYSHLATLLDRIDAERPDVWEVITDIGRLQPGLGAGFAAAPAPRDAVWFVQPHRRRTPDSLPGLAYDGALATEHAG